MKPPTIDVTDCGRFVVIQVKSDYEWVAMSLIMLVVNRLIVGGFFTAK